MKFFAAILLVAVSAIKVREGGDVSAAEQVKAFGEKLGIEIPAEVAELQDNAAISEALVNVAVENGKTEEEIGEALGMWVNVFLKHLGNLLLIVNELNI